MSLLMWKTLGQKIKACVLRRTQPSKIRLNIQYQKPEYFNRHEGREFLILGTGGSIKTFGDQVKAFAKEKKLVTMGVNSIADFMNPDYHGFSNRRRLVQYGSSIDPQKSKALMSIFFTDALITNYCHVPFDLIMWKPVEDGSQSHIDSEGIIYHHGGSASLLVMVAYVMGAKKIYLAGLDGYTPSKEEIHYQHVPYNKEGVSEEDLDEKYQYWLFEQGKALDALHQWALDNQRISFSFITPTTYEKYYDPGLLSAIKEIGK